MSLRKILSVKILLTVIFFLFQLTSSFFCLKRSKQTKINKNKRRLFLELKI